MEKKSETKHIPPSNSKIKIRRTKNNNNKKSSRRTMVVVKRADRVENLYNDAQQRLQRLLYTIKEIELELVLSCFLPISEKSGGGGQGYGEARRTNQ